MAKKPTLAASTLSRDSGVRTRGSDSPARRRNDIKRSVHHLRARGCGYACSFTNVGVHWSFTSPPSPSRVVRLGLPQPLGGPRHTLALHVELHQPGQGQTSDPEQTDARGGSHLGRDVIRDDLRARGEGHGESTSESVIFGRGVYDALRLRPDADLEPGVQDKGKWDTHEVQGDVRVHGQGNPEREIDRGNSPGDGHGGRHQTCAIGRGRGCQERKFSSHAKIPLEPSRVGARARTSQREPRGVVDLHHHRTAISCEEGRGTGVSRQYLVIFRARGDASGG